MPRHRPSLDFYSFDYVDNPWLGGGGAYRDLEILSRWVASFGRVRLFIGGFPGAKPHQRQGIEVIPLGNGQSEWLSRCQFALRANWKLWRNPADVIGLSLSLYSPLFAAFRYPHRTYGVLHHIIGRQWLRKLGPVGPLFCHLEMAYYRVVRHFVLSNQTVADTIAQSVPHGQVFLSSNAFNPALLQVQDAVDTEKPFILFIGRLDRFMKGLDVLMQAFASIKDKYPKVGLVMAGHAEPAAEVELRGLAAQWKLSERLTLHKDISETEKYALLSRCLFFCSPSRFEGFGIAALEASAAGKAVLVSNASGFQASVSQGFSGIRVDIETENALASALDEMLSDSSLRQKLGTQGRQWAQRFTWEAIADRELEWLGQCFGFLRHTEEQRG
jgi:glycosyltransferase involved in cell wall biosynthesis